MSVLHTNQQDVFDELHTSSEIQNKDLNYLKDLMKDQPVLFTTHGDFMKISSCL